MPRKNITEELNSRVKDILDYDFDKMLENIEKYNGKTGPEIELNGIKGRWINKEESDNWIGDIPLDQYEINIDPNPIVINKKAKNEINYEQQLAIRYLKPPTPIMGDIIVEQEPDISSKPLAPIIMRQVPPPENQKEGEIIYRELPPAPPKMVDRQIVKIPGKKLPPPPRKLIVEILPPLPTKPQPVILERWLTPKPVKRRVVYERAPPIPQQKLNEKPEIVINKKYFFINASDLGIKNQNEKNIDVLLEGLAKQKLSNSQKNHKKHKSNRRQAERANKKDLSRSFSKSIIKYNNNKNNTANYFWGNSNYAPIALNV